jgi:hypothetical protein
MQNHENEYVRGIGQGEARHRKYKRLKLGGGQAYGRSSDAAAVVAQDTQGRHDLLCKACTDRGLVCSATARIFHNMLHVRYVHLTQGQAYTKQTNPSSRQRGRYIRTMTARVQL